MITRFKNFKRIFFEADESTTEEQPSNEQSSEESTKSNNVIDTKEYQDGLTEIFKDKFKSIPNGIKNIFNTFERKVRVSIKDKDKENLLLSLENFKTDCLKVIKLLGEKRWGLERDYREDKYSDVDFSKINKGERITINRLAFLSTQLSEDLEENIKKAFNINLSELASFLAENDDGEKETTAEFTKKLELTRDNLIKAFSNADAEFSELTLESDSVKALTDELFLDVKDNISLGGSKEDSEKKKEPKLIENLTVDGVKKGCPQLFANFAEKIWGTLPTLDKNVLHFYANQKKLPNYVANDGLIYQTTTAKLKPEAIVMLCCLALNFVFPPDGNKGSDDDIELDLSTFKYKGGGATADIIYKQPDSTKGHDDDKMLGSDIDKQFIEVIIDPDVDMKNSKGRAQFVINTADKEDETKLVKHRSKRMTIYEFIRLLNDEDFSLKGNERRGRGRW